MNTTTDQKQRIGYPVKMDMPGLKGPEVEALNAQGRKWWANKLQ
jgi:hypothetical protein